MSPDLIESASGVSGANKHYHSQLWPAACRGQGWNRYDQAERRAATLYAMQEVRGPLTDSSTQLGKAEVTALFTYLKWAAEPLVEAVMMPMCAACRVGKGTHYGVIRAQSHMRRLAQACPVYCLKMDFSKYFANINRAVLIGEIRRKISCKATLQLIETITPPTGKGLPIGNLTSQLWANLYGHMFDRFLVHELGIRHATRYMDDTVVFGTDLADLRRQKEKIDRFVTEEMRLQFSKWSIQPITRGVNFLGYRIWTTHRLLRRDSVQRAKRKLRWLREQGDQAALARFVASWSGHAGWADSRNLLTSLKLQPL